jgi:hypothetical protein
VRFPLPAEALAALRVPTAALAIAIDHPNYRARTPLSEDMRASLAADYP